MGKRAPRDRPFRLGVRRFVDRAAGWGRTAEARRWQKIVAAAQKEAAEFIKVVRGELGANGNDASVAWFAPGQLLVIGTREQHAKAETLFANLADGKAKLTGACRGTAKVTAKRFAERKAQAEQSAKASALLRIANIHEQFGWQLLAAAAAGRSTSRPLPSCKLPGSSRKQRSCSRARAGRSSCGRGGL